MKKTLALILSVLALLIPVSAIDLDVAEAADVAVEETAVLAASGATPTVPVYDATYGELIYFEDFEDGSKSDAYAPTGTNAFIWTSGDVLDNPVGDGKVFKSTASYLQFRVDGGYPLNATKVMISVDILNYENATANIPVCFLDIWLDPWHYWTNDQISKTEWTTKSVTKTQNVTITPGESGNFKFYFGGNGMYFDNIKVYAKYDIGENARLYENNVFTTIDTGLETYTFPAPADAAFNAWKADDDNPYIAGQTVSVEDVKGKTFVPCYVPAIYDDSLGELYWYNNFEFSTSKPVYTTDRFTGTGGVATGGTIILASKPDGTGNAVMITPDQKHCGYALTYNSVDFGGASVTWQASYYFPVDDDKSSYTWWSDFRYTGNQPQGGWSGISTGTWHNVQQKGSISAGNVISAFDFYCSSASKVFYIDDVKLYVEPVVSATQVRLIENEYTPSKMIEIGETYTFVAPADSAFNGWMSEDGNKYAAGKTYSAAEVGGKTYTPCVVPKYAAKPEATHDTYGTLIFFENFSGEDFNNTAAIDVIGTTSTVDVVDGYYGVRLEKNSEYSFTAKGFVIKPTTGTWSDNGYNGKITLVADLASATDGMRYWPVIDVSRNGYWGWGTGWYVNSDAGNGLFDVVANKFSTGTFTVDTGVNKLGYYDKTAEGHHKHTLRSVAVYYNPYTVTIDGELVDIGASAEYTLPVKTGCGDYMDADGNIYAAGTAYASSDLNGKVLTAIKYGEKPATTTEDGTLVFFYNGNDADSVNDLGAVIKGISGTSVYDGYNVSVTLKDEFLSCYSHGVAVAPANGSYTKNGKLTLIVEQFNNEGENISYQSYSEVKGNQYQAPWINGYEGNVKITINNGEWGTLKTTAVSANKLFGFGETVWYQHVNPTRGFKSVAVYLQPYTATFDGEVVDLSDYTEYTFPEITDGINTVWKDANGNIYFPGDVAAVETINDVTFTPANFDAYAPETDDNVEIRLTSNTAENGIRFKASIVTSKKTAADEIGFIVARGDVLTKLASELTFDLTAEGVDNAEGKLFVKGVAYDKASGKNIIYDTTPDGSAEVFTGVCVGIDTTNKEQVTTALVARPYVKMTVAGKQVTVYGGIKSSSLAEAAQNLKTAAESGNDEAALNAYNGSKDYIDGVISVAAGN